MEAGDWRGASGAERPILFILSLSKDETRPVGAPQDETRPVGAPQDEVEAFETGSKHARKGDSDDAIAGGTTRTLQPPYGRGVAKLKKEIPSEEKNRARYRG